MRKIQRLASLFIFSLLAQSCAAEVDPNYYKIEIDRFEQEVRLDEWAGVQQYLIDMYLDGRCVTNFALNGDRALYVPACFRSSSDLEQAIVARFPGIRERLHVEPAEKQEYDDLYDRARTPRRIVRD
jgi:hypothetical protein